MKSEINDGQWTDLSEAQKAERLAGVIVTSVEVFRPHYPFPGGEKITGTVDGSPVVVEYTGTASFLGQFPERKLARQAGRMSRT